MCDSISFFGKGTSGGELQIRGGGLDLAEQKGRSWESAVTSRVDVRGGGGGEKMWGGLNGGKWK